MRAAISGAVAEATPAFFAIELAGSGSAQPYQPGLYPHIDFGDVADLSLGDATTMAAWVRRAKDNAFEIIFSRRRESNPRLKGWSFQINSGGRFGASLLRGSAGLVRYSQNYVMTVGVWHLLVITWTGEVAPASLTFYLDGHEVTATITDQNLNGPINVAAHLRIGAEENSSTADNTVVYPLSGQIGPCGLWNRVLTEEEVLELAQMRVAVDWRKHSAGEDLIWHPAIDGYADLSGVGVVRDRSASGWDGDPIALDSSKIIPVYPHELPEVLP